MNRRYVVEIEEQVPHGYVLTEERIEKALGNLPGTSPRYRVRILEEEVL